MELNHDIGNISGAFLFIAVGVVFVLGGFFTSWIIRPKRPNPQKLTSYESGEDPQGSAWGKFNIRFYIIALIFILFEVEIIFLLPWSTVFGNKELVTQTNGLWGWFSLVEVFIFVFILLLGLAYAWVKGYLDWVKPKPETPTFKGVVPNKLYEKVNEKYTCS